MNNKESGLCQIVSIAALAFLQNASAAQVFAEGEHRSTRDLFYPSEWKKKKLENNSEKIAGHFYVKAGASFNKWDTEFELSQKAQGYFWGNSNMVYVAAKGDGIRVPRQNGNYDFTGEYYFLHSTQMAAIKEFKLSRNIRIRVEPHIFAIHDYHYGKSDLDLVVKNGSGALQGSLYRMGTRDFGPLRNNKKDEGWGWGLNLGAQFRIKPLIFDVRFDNLLSQLRFSNIHWSDRQYNASVQSGQITGSGSNLAMTGFYNQKNTVEKLPLLSNVGVRHRKLENLSVGFYHLGNTFAPWVKADLKYRNYAASLSSIEFKNLMVNLMWNHRSGLQAGIGISFTRESSAQLGGAYIRYTW